MNKYVMIPVEQYERYKAFMKSSNEKIKDKDESRQDSEIMSNKIAEDFSQEIDTDKDYKRTSSQKNLLIRRKTPGSFHLPVYQTT